MRALLSVAVLAFSAAGLGQASAADLYVGRTASVSYYATDPVRAGQFWIYDDQPGVYVRSYWREPWRHRHYYPFTGKKPKVGRHERLNAKRRLPEPAETYYREWSTISLFPPRGEPPPPDNAQPLVVIEQPSVVTSVPRP